MCPTSDSPVPRISVLALWLLLFVLPSCATPGPGDRKGIDVKLASVGLRIISSEEARLPAGERDRELPVDVIPGFTNPALPEDPSGYLIVGLDGELVRSTTPLIHALETWSPTHPVHFIIRRNPYLVADAEWWEADVTLRLPR